MTPDDLARFRRIAGLLASDQIGERAAAALKCTELLKAHGLSWSDVTLPVSGPDVLAQRSGMNADDLERAVRRANPSRANQAEKRAAWAQARYAADADGFEPK